MAEDGTPRLLRKSWNPSLFLGDSLREWVERPPCGIIMEDLGIFMNIYCGDNCCTNALSIKCTNARCERCHTSFTKHVLPNPDALTTCFLKLPIQISITSITT